MPFVEVSHDKLLERVQKMWKFGSLPYPKFEMKCPICGSKEFQVRYWGFHKRPAPHYPYRCDLWVKCTRCSAVYDFGVAIPKEMFDKWVKEGETSRRVDWREAKEIYYKEVEKYGLR